MVPELDLVANAWVVYVYLASFLLLATYRAIHSHFDAQHESVGASCDFPWTAMHRRRPLDSRTYICGDLWLALAPSLKSGPILSIEAEPTYFVSCRRHR